MKAATRRESSEGAGFRNGAREKEEEEDDDDDDEVDEPATGAKLSRVCTAPREAFLGGTSTTTPGGGSAAAQKTKRASSTSLSSSSACAPNWTARAAENEVAAPVREWLVDEADEEEEVEEEVEEEAGAEADNDGATGARKEAFDAVAGAEVGRQCWVSEISDGLGAEKAVLVGANGFADGLGVESGCV